MTKDTKKLQKVFDSDFLFSGFIRTLVAMTVALPVPSLDRHWPIPITSQRTLERSLSRSRSTTAASAPGDGLRPALDQSQGWEGYSNFLSNEFISYYNFQGLASLLHTYLLKATFYFYFILMQSKARIEK